MKFAQLLRRAYARHSTRTCARQFAQATIEFTFTMVIAVLLTMGMIQVFRWTGKDLAEKRRIHERELRDGNFGPIHFPPIGINAAVSSNIFGTN